MFPLCPFVTFAVDFLDKLLETTLRWLCQPSRRANLMGPILHSSHKSGVSSLPLSCAGLV